MTDPTDPITDPTGLDPRTDDETGALSAIAIVGLAGRFPGARNVEALWRNLRDGVESIFPVSEAELADSGLPPETWRDPRYVRASPSLEGIDLFDARFFGFSPREAALLDPQHRLFLETAWEALGNAGYDPHGYAGSIGVFAGCQFNQYLLWNVLPVSGSLHPAEIAGLRQLADKDYLATRTSYLFNLRGPSLAVQTACSTSLVAAHLASRSLLGHECDMALVGGVCLTVPHRAGYLYQKGGILSPDGHCRPFDAAAQGTVMGSGAGVLVLKRLEDAIEDGDTVRAVLLGSCVNNDGSAKVGYTAPSVDAQSEAIAGAQSFAGVSPDSISYVEAHGTGTPMGDPIEMAALTLAFRRGTERRGFCAVGSLKSNLGHLEAAAGVAGVIKTVLALEHGEIPPSLHCLNPNPEIDWEGSPFFVNTELRPWRREAGAPRRAGVSSFGVGGTNAHAVLEEAPPFVPGSPSRRWQLLPLSAKTATALETATSELAAHLGGAPSAIGDPDPARAFADAAYTLKVGRRSFAHRRIVVARDGADAAAALASLDPQRILSRREERADRPVAFLFPGQGAQYPGMARGLYAGEPTFREEIDRCCDLLAPHLGLDLRALLFPPEGTEPEVAAARLTETAHAQPALFVVEYALARLWMSWGVEPAALLGHSIGEYVAACLAGVFSLPDALALVAARGRLMQGTAPGAMLSLPLSEPQVLPLLGEELALAALNAPGLSVVAGPVAAVEALAARLTGEGVDARRLHTSHAFHSRSMEPVLAAFEAEVAKVELSAPKIPFVSNLTGTWIRAEEATDPGYWARHLRGTVRFADGLAALRERSGLALLEVGPGRTLATLVARGEGEGRSPVIPSLPAPPRAGTEAQDDQEHVLTALGRLWLAGARLDWNGFYAGERRLRVPLPTHPFERQRYWIDPPRQARSEPRADADALAALGLEGLVEEGRPNVSAVEPPSLGALHPRPDLETAYVAPRDEAERLLAAIWGEMLGLARIGIHDSFFELGGHSLMATQLVSRVRDRFGVELPLAGFFDAPTIAALAPRVSAGVEAGETSAPPGIPRVPRDRPIPLTFAQQRLWFLHHLAPGAGYNMPLALRAEGALEPEILERALAEIVRRHESLRTTFVLAGEGAAQAPVQVIAAPEEGAAHLARVDLSKHADPLAAALQLAQEEARTLFDLERGPLLRARLLRLGEVDHVLLLTLHHIVSDGWSTGLLVRELAALYAAFSRGEPSPLPPLAVQYADFAVWQQAELAGERLAGQLAWWRERLGGALPALELPLDRPRPPLQTFHGAKLPLALEPELADGLRSLARERGATLYMVLLAGFQTFLRRYSGQTDLLVGTPIAGRSRSELEGLIGLFANTLVLRADLADALPFGELVDRVRGITACAYAHQEVPFERLVEELNPRRDLARSPLFQVMLSLDNNLAARAVPAAEAGGLAISPLAADSGAARYEQTWFLHEEVGGRIAGVLEYNTDLFDEATAIRMAGCFRHLLAAAIADLGERITRLPLLSGDEERQLLVDWNETARPFRLDRPLHELVAERAKLHPEARAVSCEGQVLTYGELEARAAQLARRLRALGVGPEVPVGLYLDRTIQLPVALLAVWKAGGAYLPLDPAYPKDRLAYMLEDSQAPLVLTESPLLASLPATSARAVCLDRESDFEAGAGETAPGPEIGADSLAYILYTSGSTGKPKGVQIPHGALVNFLESMRERPGIGRGDRLLAVTSLSFDIAGLELYLPLLAGAEVEIASRALTADGVRLLARLAEATVFQATPSTWRLLLDAGWSGDPQLKALCGGEALPPKLAREIAARAGSLWNMYGPTETTIWSATRLVPPDEKEGTQPVSIGRPIANTSIYIVDAEMRPAPVGVPGELLIGGSGLARGYLGRPDLTAERFLPDPFATLENRGARLYRTGDLARYLADGDIEFLGRIDHQVKVRGYRIELGEIEAALELHAGVSAAVVLVREDVPGDPRITAYLAVQGGEVAAGELRRHLRSRLPEYMVPSAFVVLPELPLLPNGKIDRKSLPAPRAPSLAAPAAGAAGIPSQARGGIEETIAGAWRETLRLDRVGRDDNFFDLGGHSLLLAQVHLRLRETLPPALAAGLTMMELFQFPTIASLARHLAPGGEALKASGETGRSRAELRRDASGRLGTEIAIVGMSGRFPGAPGVEAYWRNLCDGVESVSRFTEEELTASGVPPETFRAANYINAKAIPDGIGWFDAGFFGYTPREAEIIDPQQRMFLEVAWEALEDAGCDPSRHPGLIGVFAGSGFNTYLVNLYSNPDLMAAIGGFQATINNDKDFLPTRVSYKLDLKGPSLNVQTACSTSLVAVHVACQHLLHGECDLALAGGVTLYFPVKSGTIYHEGGVLAPDGRCHAFDDRAKGTVVGNGSGAVVLKRLDDALADGDAIYAVIKGSAINNDGSVKVGYTAPSVDGQVAVISQALAAAGVEPGTIGYVEAHGTGTILGDPIEVRALTRAYRAAGVEAERTGFCGLGSAKTAVGHLDTAAGVAGLIKATLAVERGTIPPSLNYERPNPALEIETTPFYVVDKLQEWPSEGAPRRAGVSAFGIGGTNAHVILEQAPAPASSASARETNLLLLSARTETALEAATDNLARWLREHEGEGEPPLADVAFTLQAGRKLFAHRRAVVAGSYAEAATALECRDPKRVLTSQGEGSARPVVFLFAGGGTQYADMGLDLYRSEPLFRAELDRALDLFAPHVEADLRRHLFPALHATDPAPPFELERTSIALPVLFATEMALARLWMSWGIKPQAMLGHSLGEYAAACLAGVMSLEDAVAMVALRGRLIETLPAGGMITVPLPEAEVLALLAELLPGQDLSIAAVNGPAFCVVSGPAETIGEAREALAARGIDARRLHIAAAGHSSLIEPILEEFGRFVATLALSPPQIPYLSNVTGTWITAADATDPNYWCRHLRQTVRFAEGATLLLEDPERIFLEVGAGQTLSTLVRQHPARKPSQTVLPSLRHPQDPQPDGVFLLAALGKLWQAGADVDWKAFQGGARRRVRLPTYPFDREYYWVETRRDGFLEMQRKLAVRRRPDPADWLYAPAWRQARLQAGGVEVEVGDAPLLVFLDRNGVGERLAARLRELERRVVTVTPGDAFARAAEEGVWTVRPRERSDYEALLRALEEDGRSPKGAIHLWCVGDGSNGVPVEDLGFHSLLAFTQAVAGRTGPAGGEPMPPFRLDVVTSGLHTVVGGEEIEPEKALILGPIKVAPQEIPNLRCRAIDIDLPKAGSRNERTLVEMLIAEVTSGESGASGATAPDIAYRNGQRWVLGYESVSSTCDEPAPTHQPAGSTDDLPTGLLRSDQTGDRQVARQRTDGFYLITGGLGGVGSALAAHLARRTPGARLVLLGRTPLPERSLWDAYLADHAATDRTARRLRRILGLEALGADVVSANADVCDAPALRAALASAHAHFGVPPRGVIHAAGVAPGGMIQTKTPEAAGEVLAAKVLGTRNLAEAVSGEPLDFFVLCSAASSALGGFGRVDLCAASAYLDAFALRLAAETDLPVLSLDWDTWSETGVAAEAELPPDLEEALRQSLLNGMATREALEVFDRALSLGLPRVVVSTRDLEGLLARKSAAKAEGEAEKPRLAASHGRPSLNTSFVAPSTPAEKTVAGVWEDFLGIQGIGAHDNFFELGGHSLMATQITSRLRDTFRAEISIATFFTEPTVAGIAAALRAPASLPQSEAPAAPPPKLDDLLDDIEGLSEEELDALLAAEESRVAREGSHV